MCSAVLYSNIYLGFYDDNANALAEYRVVYEHHYFQLRDCRARDDHYIQTLQLKCGKSIWFKHIFPESSSKVLLASSRRYYSLQQARFSFYRVDPFT